jgi:hypothetical protein
MTTKGKSTPVEPPEPRKKGGGDGNAKSATPKARPGKARDEANSPDPAAGPDVRSRKITTRG